LPRARPPFWFLGGFFFFVAPPGSLVTLFWSARRPFATLALRFPGPVWLWPRRPGALPRGRIVPGASALGAPLLLHGPDCIGFARTGIPGPPAPSCARAPLSRLRCLRASRPGLVALDHGCCPDACGLIPRAALAPAAMARPGRLAASGFRVRRLRRTCRRRARPRRGLFFFRAAPPLGSRAARSWRPASLSAFRRFPFPLALTARSYRAPSRSSPPRLSAVFSCCFGVLSPCLCSALLGSSSCVYASGSGPRLSVLGHRAVRLGLLVWPACVGALAASPGAAGSLQLRGRGRPCWAPWPPDPLAPRAHRPWLPCWFLWVRAGLVVPGSPVFPRPGPQPMLSTCDGAPPRPRLPLAPFVVAARTASRVLSYPDTALVGPWRALFRTRVSCDGSAGLCSGAVRLGSPWPRGRAHGRRLRGPPAVGSVGLFSVPQRRLWWWLLVLPHRPGGLRARRG